MKCEHIEELLSLYLEDELSREERASVESHLETCADCRELLALLRETTGALEAFPEVAVSAALQDRLYAIPERKKRFSFGLDVFLRPALQPIYVTATIFLMLLSFYAFHPDRSTINKNINREIHRGYSKIGRLYTQAESFAVSLFDQTDNLFDSLKNSKLFKGKEN